MIFAEMEYPQEYWDFHEELVAYVKSNFNNIEYGHQSDSWIWIFDGEDKVAIDTFSSMKHQIKSSHSGRLVKNVMNTIAEKYKLRVYRYPELEAHEDI